MYRQELIAIRLELIKKTYPLGASPVLVAVTKKRPLEDIEYAHQAGQRDFGENRVNELWEKATAMAEKKQKDIRWHFVGNLQSNKINLLFKVPSLAAIHSVHSFSLMEELYARDSSLPNPVFFFLQVNTSGEREKSGFEDREQLMKVANLIGNHPDSPLQFKGLMTMSKIRTDDFTRDARECFKKLHQHRLDLQNDFGFSDLKLSMGMSADYELALPLGTDYIRLGSALFKPEEKSP